MTFLRLTHAVRDIAITLLLSLQVALTTCKPCGNHAATPGAAGVAGLHIDTDGVSAAALAPGAAGAGFHLVDTVSVSAAPLAKT